MVARLIAMYKRPADEEAFNARYFPTHLDLVKQLPGLQRVEVMRGLGRDAPYWMMTQMTFENRDALMAAVGSPEASATIADVEEFAGDIVTILLADERESWEPGT